MKRLKQTEDVGLIIHAIPLANLHTVSISDAALDLDRPNGSTQGGFMVGFTFPRPRPTRISSHVTYVLVVAQGETKCVCVSGWRGLHDERRVGRMRMDRRCVGVGGLSRLRTLVTPTEIDIITRRAHGDRHGRGQPLTRPQCVSLMRKVLSKIWYENRREVIADGQHKKYA